MARTKARKSQNGARTRPRVRASNNEEASPSRESIKAAEDLALAAFASGLKLAAAFGTVAAKTTSLALASIATGADKFSELVRQEALRTQGGNSHPSPRSASSDPTRKPKCRSTRRRRLMRPRLAA